MPTITKEKNYIEYPREIEYEIVRKAKENDVESINKLINNNVRLVSHIAAKFKDRGVAFHDLYQEGILGIYKSIENFDFEKEVKFSTHCYFWITKKIQLALENNDIVVKPTNYHGLIYQINKAKDAIHAATGEEATTNQISEWLINDAGEDAPKSKVSKYEPQAIDDCIRFFQKAKSLNYTPEGGESDSEYDEYIANDIDRDFFEEHCVQDNSIDNIKFWHHLNKILETLTHQERVVLTHRFGIGVDELPAKKIAKLLDIKEREVAGIEQKALLKIKNFNVMKELFEEMIKNGKL